MRSHEEEKTVTVKQVKDVSLEQLFIPEDSGFTRHILRRVAWVGMFIACLFLLPVSVFLWTMRMAKSFVFMSFPPVFQLFGLVLVTIGFILLSAVSFFFPSLGNWAIRFCLLSSPPSGSSSLRQSRGFQTKVMTNKGKITIAEWDVDDDDEKNDQYTIKFGGNRSDYRSLQSDYRDHADRLNRNVCTIDYCSEEYLPESSNDLINQGIAVIHKLATDKNWSNEDISKKMQLFGWSLGGAVALQVAKHFKEKYNIDIPIHLDRSFRSLSAVIAVRANDMSVPTWYGKIFSSLLLYAGGGWEMDSIKACEPLNKNMIHYMNLGHQEERNLNSLPSKSRFQRTMEWFGLERPFSEDADNAIPDGATFAEGVEEARQTAGSTGNIFAELKVTREQSLVFAFHPDNPHGDPLSSLGIINDKYRSAFSLYEENVERHAPPSAPSPSLGHT